MKNAVITQEDLVTVVDRLGYGAQRRRENFPVWLGDAGLVRVGLAAFTADTPQDMTTSALVGAIVEGPSQIKSIMAAARTCAAPAAILAVATEVEIWQVGASVQADTRIQTFPEHEMSRLVSLYRDRLAPDAIAAAKSSSGRQLEMFPLDIGLLAWAQRSSSKSLLRLVTDGLEVALEGLPSDQLGDERRMKEAARMVVGALAALMVRDKVQRSPPSMPTQAVLEAAGRQFPRYFDWIDQLPAGSLDTFRGVMDALGTDVNYESLDPSIISEVYEEAVVGRQTRRDRGIYYTPPALARQVVAHIPFEEIEPNSRYTYDFACGAGNLLVAAYNRLDRLLPPRTPPGEKHELLTRLILGQDEDPFAVQLAGLSLLVNALPRGDSWRVREGDSLVKDPPARPAVIVSNPPWDDERPPGQPREQRADRFVIKAINLLRPGGYLGLLLPASWLSSDASSETREYLRTQCELFEVIRLPERTFASAALAPCVVMARKGPHTGRRYLYRRLMGGAGIKSGRHLKVGEQILVPQEAPVESIPAGPLQPALEHLRSLRPLGSVADIISGPVPKPPVKNVGGRGEFLWLRYAGDLPSYGAPPSETLVRVRFPEDFHHFGNENNDKFRSPKLFLSAKSNVNNPWRLKVGYAGPMVIPRESLFSVFPNEPADLPALLMILGSAVASAWIDTYGTKTAYGSKFLRTLPVPPSGRAWEELKDLGTRIIGQKTSGQELAEIVGDAEQLVWDAYDLPGSVRIGLGRHFGGRIAPEGRLRFASRSAPPDQDAATTLDTYGAVLEVGDADITLWVSGVSGQEGIRVDVPDALPGWLCYQGAPFLARVSAGDLVHAEYRFQPHAYRLTPAGFEWPHPDGSDAT